MRTSALVFALAAAVLAGCSDTTGAAPAYPAPSATPNLGVPVPAAFTATASAAGTAGANITVAPAGITGFMAGDTLPDASAAVTITDTVSSAPPNGDVPLAAQRSAQAAEPFAGTVVDYLTISTTGEVTFTGTPTYTFTLPNIPAGYNFYLASYSGGVYANYAGPGVVTGTSITFTGTAGTFTLEPGTNETFAFYALPTGDTPVSGAPITVSGTARGSK